MTAKVSSIHVNGWFGTYDKLAMTRTLHARGASASISTPSASDFVFVGDSPNDAPMFGYFPHAVGVANVMEFAGQLAALPAYVTQAASGAGFCEVDGFPARRPIAGSPPGSNCMIDLRSDTVTQPTEAMLAAMQEATYGDDSRDGDPTVQKLEALAAAKTGKEAGAFMPSGTMTNLVAMLAHAQRGGEVLLEEGSHTLSSELGGMAALAGLFYRTLPGMRGRMDLNVLREKIKRTHRNQMGTVARMDGKYAQPCERSRRCRSDTWPKCTSSRATTAFPCMSMARVSSTPPPRSTRAQKKSRSTATACASAFPRACRRRLARSYVEARISSRSPRVPPHGRRQHAPGRSARRRRHRRA